MELFSKYQVALTDDCVAHGGRQEYPDGWIGEEAIPARMEEGVLQSASAEVAKTTEALTKAQKARRGIKDARLTLEMAEGRRDNAFNEAATEYFNSMPYRIKSPVSALRRPVHRPEPRGSLEPEDRPAERDVDPDLPAPRRRGASPSCRVVNTTV